MTKIISYFVCGSQTCGAISYVRNDASWLALALKNPFHLTRQSLTALTGTPLLFCMSELFYKDGIVFCYCIIVPPSLFSYCSNSDFCPAVLFLQFFEASSSLSWHSFFGSLFGQLDSYFRYLTSAFLASIS